MPGILRADSGGKRKGPVAVIDIGSNSIRLVVYDGAKRAPLPVFNEKVVCGLGRGLDAGGAMSTDSMDLALKSLHRFVALTDSMDTRRVRAVATAAVRDAVNGPDFVDRIKRECGLEVEVLSGKKEARLSAKGVISALPNADGVMADFGGGSVELVRIADGKSEKHATLPLGALRLIGSGYSPDEIAENLLNPQLSSLPWLPDSEGGTFYAVGGAWRALARVHMDQVRYPLRVIHNYRISAVDALYFARFVGNLSRNTLERVEGVSRQRLDAVPYAAKLLERLLEDSKVHDLVFCAYGLREGCLYDRLSKRRRALDPLVVMCEEVAGRTGRATADGEALSDWISPVFTDQSDRARRLRLAAAHLADIGWSEHPDYRAEQVFLRILRMPLIGLDHAERAMLALSVASRHAAMDEILRRWRIDSLLDREQIAEARATGLAMRLGYTVSGGAIRLIETIRLERDGDNLALILPDHADILVGDVVERRFRALAKVMKCDYEVFFVNGEATRRQALA